MRVVFLGPPGSGKGTQSIVFAKSLGVPHISTGDLLRDEVKSGSELGKRLKHIMDEGNLVSDEVLMETLGARLEHEDTKNGFVLDGTPRNLEQADLIESKYDIDYAVFIDVSDEEVTKRITARWSCPVDGQPYNTLVDPPKVEGKCDKHDAELTQRSDDNPEGIKKRLEKYHTETKPVTDFYEEAGKLITINGEQSIEDVKNEILEKTK